MVETIITGLITGGVTLAVCIVNNRFQHNKTLALIDYKLTELSKRVDKHNNVVERTYELEKVAELHEEKIKVANHRIDDLEKGG